MIFQSFKMYTQVYFILLSLYSLIIDNKYILPLICMWMIVFKKSLNQHRKISIATNSLGQLHLELECSSLLKRCTAQI